MKATRILTALVILAAAGGAYASASDNSWLVDTPIGQQASAPAPAGGDTSTRDPLNTAVEP